MSIFEVRKALSSTVLPFKHVGVLCCRYYSFPLYIAVLCTSMQLKKIVESGIVVACVSQMIFDETYF